MTSMQITLPTLYCPFPSAINVNADLAQEHTLAWVREFQLIGDKIAYTRLVASKFGFLAARAYPDAPLEELKLVSDWNTWLFILDDQCDEAGVGKRPRDLAALHARLLAILIGAEPQRGDPPTAHALGNLRDRLQKRANAAWMSRFVLSVNEYFESSEWEATNRALQITPDIETYIKMRPYTGGLYTDIELIEITETIALPLHVRRCSAIERLTLMANNVVCWSNDIISCEKETYHNDVHNLVVLLQRHEGLSQQAAIERAADMNDEEVRRFIALEACVPRFGEEHDGSVQRYLSVLRSWMRGNLDWACASGRYRMSPSQPTVEKFTMQGFAGERSTPSVRGRLLEAIQ